MDFQRRIDFLTLERDINRLALEMVCQEKKAVEDEKSKQERKNDELQTSVGELVRLVDSMKIEEEMLSNKFVDLEKKYVTICNNKAELQKEIEVLVEQKKGTEERIVSLDKEKSSITKDLEDARKELEQQKLRIELIVHEKTELESAKIQGDSEIIKLNEQLRVSEDKISSLEMSSANQVEKIKQLEGEVSTYRASNDQAIIERDETLESLDKEKSITSERIDSLTRERDRIRTALEKSDKLVNDMGRSIDQLRQEKKAVEDEKSMQERKNDELQTSVGELERLVDSMKIEEEMLSNKFADLEKKYVTTCNNEAELQKEIQVLVEQKKGTEERIVSLDNEKSSITKDLEDARKELEQQKLRIEQIVHEKTELESAKIQGDSEIIKLNEQLRVSEDKISSLEMSSANQVEKIKQLEGEVSTYRASNDQAIIERDETLESLDKEKSITSDNKEKIAIMEQEIEDLRKEVANMTTEIGELLREKKELETRCEKLEKYVASLETELTETRMEFDDTNGKLSVAEANAERVLMFLKKTLSVCGEDDEENGVKEGIKDHVTQIKAIKSTFNDKESRLEEMKRQLELVKKSAAEARKRKSFWTMVSSATTLLAAAAAFAYVARAHR